MKNKKLLKAIAVLTLGSAAAFGMAFAGCTTTTAKWQSDANGHWKESDKSDIADHIDEDHNGRCDVCEWEMPDDDPNKDPDDPNDDPNKDPDDDPDEDEEGVFTITLDAGEGTLDGTSVFKTTADGIINLNGAKYLPEAEPNAEHWHFVNWLDADGQPVDEKTAVFTADATLTAKYARDNGLWIGDEYKAELVVNPGCETHTQYWLDGKKITLDAGDELSLYLNDELMTYTVYQGSTQVVLPDPSAKVTTVTVSTDALFVLYLNDYTKEGGEPDWQVEYTGAALDIALTNKIPDGCERIEIPVGNGTVMLNIVAPDGTPINSENAANYQVHAWDGATNLFGAWADNPTLDQDLSIEYDMDLSIQWIIHWAGGQSKAFASIIPDKEYVIKLVPDGTGDCYVKIYDPTAPDEPEEEEEDPSVDTRDFYILGAGKSAALDNWGVGPKMEHEEGTNVYTLTLDLYAGDLFKFAINSSWAYAQGPEALAEMEYDGQTYFKDNSNIECLIEGNYTFTLTTNGTKNPGVITWTYNGEVVDKMEETVTHYYIKGAKITNNWQEIKTDEYELKETAEGSGVYTMTIDMEAGDEFMFISTEVGVESGEVNGGTKMIQSGALAEDVTCLTVKDSNFLTTVAGRYTFTFEDGKCCYR